MSMWFRLLTLVFSMLAPCSPALSWVPDAGELEALQAGEAVVEFTQTAESGGAARVSVLMHTSAAALWEVLLSCERSFDYVDGLQACEVLEGGLEHSLVRQSVKKHWLLPRLDYVIAFDRVPFTSIEFHKVEGDLKLLEGRWSFREMGPGQGLMVTHEIRVQPSFPVPRWLVRRSIARDVPDMLLCLRALASGSADASQAAADAALCPFEGVRAY